MFGSPPVEGLKQVPPPSPDRKAPEPVQGRPTPLRHVRPKLPQEGIRKKVIQHVSWHLCVVRLLAVLLEALKPSASGAKRRNVNWIPGWVKGDKVLLFGDPSPYDGVPVFVVMVL